MRDEPVAGKDSVQDGLTLRLLLENLDYPALLLIDPRRFILAWSRGAERLLGWPADEAVTQSSDILFSEEERRAGLPEREAQIAIEQGKAANEGWQARKDGGAFWGCAVLQPLYEQGCLIGYVKTIEDWTERQEERKRTERTQRFLAELSRNIRPLEKPTGVMWTVVTALGKHLSVTHCTYADIDEAKSQFISRANYHWKGESTAGVYPLNFFGDEIITALRDGQTFIVNDTQTDSRIGYLYATSYQPYDIRAYIVVPLIKEDRWLATLSVTMHGEPRVWTKDEIELIEKSLEMIWLAIENARLFLAERERSEQLALAISEIHHRIKNNLQSVGALLEVRIPDGETMMPVEAVRDSLSQIKTIALVHDLLSKDEPIGRVDAAAVLNNLGRLLSLGLRAGQKSTSIQVEAESVEMPTSLATSLALVVNELLTNAVKHQGKRSEGLLIESSITVRMARRATDVVVFVSDNGPGFPPGFDPAMDANIGLQVVETLVAHDLSGRVVFGNTTEENGGQVKGALVEVAFPLSRLVEQA